MESLKLVRSDRWRLAGLLGTAVVLATLLLLPVLSPAGASKTSTITSSSANQGTVSLSRGSVITIGVAADLSGPFANFGWKEANSVQLAINQINAAGGIDIGGVTYDLEMVTADSACDPTQAVTAANTLLDAGAVAVVGHTCSGASFAAQPIYNAAGVAMVSPSSTNPDLTQQGYNTTFRTIPHDGAGPALLATFFRNWLCLSSSAIVERPEVWSASMADAYENTFTALGGTITSRRAAADTSEFLAVLTEISAENPDAIFYADGDPSRSGQFSFTAYGLGMTDVVIGWSSLGNDESDLAAYVSAAGATAAEGDYASMQWRRFEDMPGWATFLADYQAAGFPNEPDDPSAFGAFAYDAANIIIAAIDRADSTDPTDIRDEIAATTDYEGVVGTYEGFDANGDVIPQWAWLERYQSGQWVILHPSKVFLPIVVKDFEQ